MSNSNSKNLMGTQADIEALFSPQMIRERSRGICLLAESGGTHFSLQRGQLHVIATFVAHVCKQNYPKLDIPFHSRWSHFNVGNVDRNEWINKKLATLSPLDDKKEKIDLVITSVPLDAGAGTSWNFFEKESAKSYGRSEGLAVASLDLFLKGKLSHDKNAPYQATAQGLGDLSLEDFSSAFQHSEKNPLQGLEGRHLLLKNLGTALGNKAEFFGTKNPRPGNLIEYFTNKFPNKKIPARSILRALQACLGEIWPGRVSVNGVNLGDVWQYPKLGEGLKSLVPFHKLSQWLTYSLVHPLEMAGFEVSAYEELSGLAEYRNGGLFVDMDALHLKDPSLLLKSHSVDSELVIEWRALTLHLLEELAPLVRRELGKTAQELPLGKILEGGTWWAGRKAAANKRPSGASPIQVQSDGTVF